MSKDNVKQMFAKIENDADFQKKYAGLMEAHRQETEKALADKLIQLGKTAGFEFSNEDLHAARAEVMNIANSNKELSDGDLANVTGGCAADGHTEFSFTFN
jgi:predicted ribosomally synthesized peptide with nif11-like leader